MDEDATLNATAILEVKSASANSGYDFIQAALTQKDVY